MEEYVFFDYLTYTIRLKEIQDVFELLGMDEEIFLHKASGMNHYTHTYELDKTLRIRYVEMDEHSKSKYGIDLERAYEVNINMTGSIINKFEKVSSFKSCFEMINAMRNNKILLAPINFTRVDLTRDDKDDLLDLDKIQQKMGKGQVVSRLSSSILMSMYDPETKRYYGKTLYYGSKDKNSEFFIRIYNKSAEKVAKKAVSESMLDEHHVRVEMVFKKAVQANLIMEKVFIGQDKKEPLGVLYSEILLSKIKILKNGKSPGQRYDENIKNLCPKFKKFLDSTKKRTLGVEATSSTIEGKIEYFKNLKKSAAIIRGVLGDEAFLEMIEEMCREGKNEISLLESIDMEDYIKKNPINGVDRATGEIL